MKLIAISTVLLAAGLFATPAQARLKVFACEPEWGSLVHELAGDKVDVDVGTSALQDVHVIEAKPSLIAKVRAANLVVCTGAELEVGWLPMLIKQSGNQSVAPGAPGWFMAASQVKLLEKPSAVDRANGDVHPDGNPHVQLDPRRVLVIARTLDARLVQMDPANAAVYQQRLGDFNTRWLAAMARWKTEAAPLRGRKVVVHHIAWAYLWDWLGIQQIGALEPKPSVPPTSAHLSSLIALTKSSNTLAIVRAAYQDPKPADWLAERTGVPAVTLPYPVGGDAQSRYLFGLFDSTLHKLLGAAK
ncbi:MAG: zinc transporter substrate-binding protein [Xanthomonadaceae bacterium]|nr:zinc transporter substrate-binding protein [Xanthomonadaceae bacterium]